MDVALPASSVVVLEAPPDVDETPSYMVSDDRRWWRQFHTAGHWVLAMVGSSILGILIGWGITYGFSIVDTNGGVVIGFTVCMFVAILASAIFAGVLCARNDEAVEKQLIIDVEQWVRRRHKANQRASRPSTPRAFDRAIEV
jgi:hypothetical protein